MLLLVCYFAGAWFVQSYLIADINGDGARDAILLVWKRGSYGRHKPSWVERDDAGLTQHVFIYSEREDGSWHPIWMSSRTGLGIRRMRLGPEIPGLSRPSLVFDGRDGETRWGWLSWGLMRLDE